MKSGFHLRFRKIIIGKRYPNGNEKRKGVEVEAKRAISTRHRLIYCRVAEHGAQSTEHRARVPGTQKYTKGAQKHKSALAYFGAPAHNLLYLWV